jgi:hypothetical protein
MHLVSIATDPETGTKTLHNGVVTFESDSSYAIPDPLHINWADPSIVLSLPEGPAFVPALLALLSDALANDISLSSQDFYYPSPHHTSIAFDNYDTAILTEIFAGSSSYAVAVRASIRFITISNAARWPAVCSILQRACISADYLPVLDNVTIIYDDQICTMELAALPQSVSYLCVSGRRLPRHAADMINASASLRSIRLENITSRHTVNNPSVSTLIISGTSLTRVYTLPSLRRIIAIFAGGAFPSIVAPRQYPSLETIDCPNPAVAGPDRVLSFITPFIQQRAFPNLPVNISTYLSASPLRDAYIDTIAPFYSAQIPYMTQSYSTWPPSILANAEETFFVTHDSAPHHRSN